MGANLDVTHQHRASGNMECYSAILPDVMIALRCPVTIIIRAAIWNNVLAVMNNSSDVNATQMQSRPLSQKNPKHKPPKLEA